MMAIRAGAMREPRGSVHGHRTVQQYRTLQQCALNATANFTFNGTGFVFYYSADGNRGSMQISVDGNLITTLNEYNSAHIYQSSYSSPTFASGSHTVQFKFVGPSGKYGTVDAIKINGGRRLTTPRRHRHLVTWRPRPAPPRMARWTSAGMLRAMMGQWERQRVT